MLDVSNSVLRIRILMDPHHFGKLDPDPHHSGRLDPDPHQSEKQDPDPHQSEKEEAFEGRVILEHWKVQIWKK
jgi:hypothetical protein